MDISPAADQPAGLLWLLVPLTVLAGLVRTDWFRYLFGGLLHRPCSRHVLEEIGSPTGAVERRTPGDDIRHGRPEAEPMDEKSCAQ